MNVPGFTAEATLYGTREHYRNVVVSSGGTLRSVVAQQLCRRRGQSCGGIDLFCCPGLRCSAGLGGHGVCACRTPTIVLRASMAGNSVVHLPASVPPASSGGVGCLISRGSKSTDSGADMARRAPRSPKPTSPLRMPGGGRQLRLVAVRPLWRLTLWGATCCADAGLRCKLRRNG